MSKYSFSPDESGFHRFCQICTDTLNKYADRKKKAIRRNHSLFINKDIAKAIMKRARFRNIYLKLRTIESKLAYAKQRNYCVTLIRKGKKKEYYGSLDVMDIKDNKKFWKTVKPLFSDKSKSRITITLVEDGKIESNHKEIAGTFNNYFAKVATSLEIPGFDSFDQHSENTSQPTLKTIVKYRKHPSITAINQAFPNKYFNFSIIEKKDIFDQIMKLKHKKATQGSDIHVKVLKENAGFFAKYLYIFFNEAVESSKFPSSLKQTNITPAFKKVPKTRKRTIDQSVFSR